MSVRHDCSNYRVHWLCMRIAFLKVVIMQTKAMVSPFFNLICRVRVQGEGR